MFPIPTTHTWAVQLPLVGYQCWCLCVCLGVCRQFRPRPAAELQGEEEDDDDDDEQQQKREEGGEEVVAEVLLPVGDIHTHNLPLDVKPPEPLGDPLGDGEPVEGQGQRHRRQFGRRRQRNSDSSASKVTLAVKSWPDLEAIDLASILLVANSSWSFICLKVHG